MNRYQTNSEQTLAEIREAVAAMTEDAAAHAVIVEGAPSDDAIVGGLFRLTMNGRVSVEAYTIVYDLTDAYGVFFNSRARLAGSRFYRAMMGRGR